MFLTVGDKVCELRKIFSIKQSAFKAFGISQNYISMIEKNQRQVTADYIKSLFDTFVILTDGKVLELYTLDEFMLTDLEQAKRWLQQHRCIDTGLDEYEQFVHIALHYSLFEQLLEFEVLLAYHYKGQHELLESMGHFLKAISYGAQTSHDVSIYYRQIGLLYIDLGQYKEANYYLLLALDYCKELESDQYYSICYDLGRSYSYLSDYEQCLNVIEGITKQDHNLMLKACGILLQELALRKNNQFEVGLAVLTDFIENCFYEPFLHFAYHNLICCYDDASMYEDALAIFEKALSYQQTPYSIAKTNCMGGLVYVHCGQFEVGLGYFKKGYALVFEQANLDQKEQIITAMSLCYFKLDRFDELVLYLDELDSLVERELLPLTHVLKNKNYLYELVLDTLSTSDVLLKTYDSLLIKLKH